MPAGQRLIGGLAEARFTRAAGAGGSLRAVAAATGERYLFLERLEGRRVIQEATGPGLIPCRSSTHHAPGS